MKKHLGVSIYPHQSDATRDVNYLETAHRYGFERVFTCLLSVDGNKDKVLADFKESLACANRLGMEVIVDISPRVLKELQLSFDDLSFFHELGVAGIRLDMGFSGLEEANMTYNPYGLNIEINMSMGTRYVDNIMCHEPNRTRLIGCHNFYPHKYAGLSYDFFIDCSKKFKAHGLRTAAFVSSQAADFGPWPIVEGLPTLEMHRTLPIDVQAKHLYATGLIEDVIVGNAYASEAELQRLSEVNRESISLAVTLHEGVTDLERKIVFDEFHFYRGDVSDYMIRSSQSRMKFRGQSFPPHHTQPIQRGDILIENDLYGQYAGELQIARRNMDNSGKTNVVGRIREEEVFLIDYIKPWGKFSFTEYKR